MSEQTEKKPNSGRKVFFAILAAILIIAAAALAIYLPNARKHPADTASTTQTAASSPQDSIAIGDAKTYDASNTEGTLSSVDIAAKVKPSVIGIEIYGRGGQLYGEGSGVVMSKDEAKNLTYIVTCAHLLSEPGTSIEVQLEDGTTYEANVIGYDTRTDIGVISIKGTDLTPAEFGDSSVLKVGEPVYAIGNPGGAQFYGSVTSGIVSAIERPTASTDSGYTQECIQHDAAINPGNSGGALVNSYGQVVGINSSKIMDDSYEGMGFAVPVTVAKNVVDDILANGYVTNRAKLGIQYVSIGANQTYSMVAEMNKLPDGSIIIAEMDDECPLKDTKAQVGDIITAVGGKELKSASVLLDVIENASPGDEITLTIAHVESDYKVTTFDVKVELLEDKGNASASDEDESSQSEGGFVNPFQNGGYNSNYGYSYGNGQSGGGSFFGSSN